MCYPLGGVCCWCTNLVSWAMIVEWIVTCDVSMYKYELDVVNLIECSTAMARGKSSTVVISTSCMTLLNAVAFG